LSPDYLSTVALAMMVGPQLTRPATPRMMMGSPAPQRSWKILHGAQQQGRA
jgi:hypothetical protein